MSPLRARVARLPLAAALASAVLLSACTSRSATAPIPPAGAGADEQAAARSTADIAAKKKKSKIQHVVIIMQENRSFDNLFQGYPGANTVAQGKNSKGKLITLQPVPLEATYGIDHRLATYLSACDGSGSIPGTNCKMDGFDLERTYGQNIPQNAEYGYVPHSESQLYFNIAGQYVLADNMFTSHVDASFVSHQYIIAGQAQNAVDLPLSDWGCSGGPSDTVATLTASRTVGPSESPCFTSNTIGAELDKKKLSWHYYGSALPDQGYYWIGYQAIKSIFTGPDWTNDVTQNPSQFLTDLGSGTLANVTWITPTWANSDHATSISNSGPEWVTSLVNAIGESQYWDTTTIFIFWDEWGGWYDHVAPPYVDFDGLGMRVPLMIVSPYAKQGYVSHAQYEHGSMLKYVEDTFGLKRLAASDKRANSPVPDAIDYSQAPRAFTPFATNLPPRFFQHAVPDLRPPDEQ
jgi:phospholipase C